MPFTGSHPAAVLPFVYLGLPPAALVIGSMVPDLPYFLPFLGHGGATHSTVGLVTVDLLLGIGCVLFWQALVGPLAWAVAPAVVRRRLPDPRRARRLPDPWPHRRPGRPSEGRLTRGGRAAGVVVLLLSLVVGSVTHVLWDEFTHPGRFGTHHVPWLAARHGTLPGYEWAQYASGLVGALLIATALLHWWRSAAVASDPSPLPGWAVIAVRAAVVAGLVAGAAAGFASAIGDDGLHRAVFLAVTWSGGAGLLMVGLAGLACAPRLAADEVARLRASTTA